MKSKVNIITTIMVVGFICAISYHSFMGSYLKLNYPFNTFLFNPDARFSDLVDELRRASGLNPYFSGFGHAVYFPFMYILEYTFLLLIPSGQDSSTLFFVCGIILFFAVVNFLVLKHGGFSKLKVIMYTFILSIMSFPILFELDRANLEAFVFISLVLFMYMFYKEHYTISAVFLAMAIAMKLTPILFVILFIKRKKFNSILLCGISTIILTLFSLLLFKSSVLNSINGVFSGLSFFYNDYVIGNGGLKYGSSIYGAIKNVIITWRINIPINELYSVTNIISILFIIAVLLFILIKNSVLWKQSALLSCLTLLCTPVASDYRLIIMFIPMWLFLLDSNKSKFDIIYAVLFGLIMIPQEYYIFYQYTVSMGEFSHPLILIVLLIILLSDKEPILVRKNSNILSDL